MSIETLSVSSVKRYSNIDGSMARTWRIASDIPGPHPAIFTLYVTRWSVSGCKRPVSSLHEVAALCFDQIEYQTLDASHIDCYCCFFKHLFQDEAVSFELPEI